MADIGSLVVKLAAETAEFREDLGKSARLLEKHADGMRSSLERVPIELMQPAPSLYLMPKEM